MYSKILSVVLNIHKQYPFIYFYVFISWKYCDIAYSSIEYTHTVQISSIALLDMKGCTCHFPEVAGIPFHIQWAVMFITTSLCLLNFIMLIVYRHSSE